MYSLTGLSEVMCYVTEELALWLYGLLGIYLLLIVVGCVAEYYEKK